MLTNNDWGTRQSRVILFNKSGFLWVQLTSWFFSTNKPFSLHIGNGAGKKRLGKRDFQHVNIVKGRFDRSTWQSKIVPDDTSKMGFFVLKYMQHTLKTFWTFTFMWPHSTPPYLTYLTSTYLHPTTFWISFFSLPIYALRPWYLTKIYFLNTLKYFQIH